MSSRPKLPPADDWPQAVGLYQSLLRHFYARNDTAKAAPLALRLLRALDRLDPKAKSLPGNEYRAVIAEVDGDYPSAVAYRVRELRMLDRLARSGQLPTVGLTWSDLADRLDLLAIAYQNAGQLDRAWAAIERSERLCTEHDLEFEGRAIKDSLARAIRRKEKLTPSARG